RRGIRRRRGAPPPRDRALPEGRRRARMETPSHAGARRSRRLARPGHAHAATCNRGKYPLCSSVFGFDPKEDPIVRPWLTDPKTDARVIRLMVYVWLMMEMDAVDYLSTVFFETPTAPFDL